MADNESLRLLATYMYVQEDFLFCKTNILDFFFHFRCVIAALFTEYQLCIYLSPTVGAKWKEAIDVSQVLIGYLKQNNFQLRPDVMQEATQQNDVRKNTNKGVSHNKKYLLFRQRTQILAFTCLDWFSQLYHTGGSISLDEGDDEKTENETFAVLTTGSQSGALIFWKVAIPVTMNSAAVQLGGFLDTRLSWPCSLSWREISEDQGIVMKKVNCSF